MSVNDKKNSNQNTNSGEPASAASSQETDQQFLEKSGTTEMIRNCLLKLIQNQPKEPIDYIIEFFDASSEKSSKVAKAAQLIKQSKYNEVVFNVNLSEAFEMLSNQKNSTNCIGITGNIFMELIELLCVNISPIFTQKFTKKITVNKGEYVNFNVFENCIFTCCLFIDHIHRCENIFNEIDVDKSGRIDKNIADALITQLQSCSSRNNNVDDIVKLIKACHDLGVKKISQCLKQSSSSSSTPSKTSTPSYKKDEFLLKLVDFFLNQIPAS